MATCPVDAQRLTVPQCPQLEKLGKRMAKYRIAGGAGATESGVVPVFSNPIPSGCWARKTIQCPPLCPPFSVPSRMSSKWEATCLWCLPPKCPFTPPKESRHAFAAWRLG